jgi:hypothetical protein
VLPYLPIRVRNELSSMRSKIEIQEQRRKVKMVEMEEEEYGGGEEETDTIENVKYHDRCRECVGGDEWM